MTFRPCASSGRILLLGRDLRALAAEPEHARDRVAPDVRVEHADLLALGLQRRGEVDGQRRLAHAALAGADADDVGDLGQRALGQPAGAAERLLQAGLLLVGQHVEADVDARSRRRRRARPSSTPVWKWPLIGQPGVVSETVTFDGPGSEMSMERTIPSSTMMRWSSGSMTTFSASRIWSLVGMRLHCRRPSVTRQPGDAARRPPRRASIAQRRASSQLGVEPERGRDLPRADAVGEHPEDRQVVRIEALADRAQRARRRASALRAVAQRVEQRARRRGLRQHRLGAGDRGAHGEPGVGERRVDDHARRLRQRRGCAGTARGRRRRAGGGRPARAPGACRRSPRSLRAPCAALAATRRPSSSSISPRSPARTAGWSSTSTMSISVRC